MKNRHIMFTTILPALGFLALSPIALAVVPAPDGGYPGNNTAEGQNALLSLTTGSFNTAVGSFSLKSDVTGGGNTAVGAATLLANTADQNTATGLAALLSNTTGDQNTANGALALLSNTIGSENSANGAFALFNNTSGSRNTANGHYALFHNTSPNGNTANGAGALQGNTTGSVNTASGVDALAANTTGSINTANGAQALFFNTTGGANTAVGADALASNTVGANNTAIGTNALTHNTTGSNNIAIGVAAGTNITTASDTICIGIVGVDTTDGCYIGHVFQEALDPDHLAMAIDVNGKVGTPASSRRFKEDIKPIDKASEAILALKPVSFHYKNDEKRRAQFGLIAEEVAEVDSSLVARDKEGKPYSVRYDQVNAMLLNEFLKEHKRVQELEAIVAQQQRGMKALAAHVREQGSRIQRVSAQN